MPDQMAGWIDFQDGFDDSGFKTVEITRFVCAVPDPVALANTDNGSLGEYSA
jgi:hypothetical protein